MHRVLKGSRSVGNVRESASIIINRNVIIYTANISSSSTHVSFIIVSIIFVRMVQIFERATHSESNEFVSFIAEELHFIPFHGQ